MILYHPDDKRKLIKPIAVLMETSIYLFVFFIILIIFNKQNTFIITYSIVHTTFIIAISYFTYQLRNCINENLLSENNNELSDVGFEKEKKTSIDNLG